MGEKPHIWYQAGRWWVALYRDAPLMWGAGTIASAWNDRLAWLYARDPVRPDYVDEWVGK